jgi:SAM-dependent methyltransferase
MVKGLKARGIDCLNMLLRRRGKMVLPLASLYEWQLNPNPGGPSFNSIALPDDAREYLTPNNPKLLDLKRRYAKCDPNVTIPLEWTDGYVRTEDIAYFRGDNAYVWQVRVGNIIGYTLATYYVKSIDNYNLLDRLTEDKAFGIFTFEIAGRIISRDLIDSIMEINFLDRHLGLMSRREITVLDIGAGYGRLAYRMSTSVPGLKEYLCVDAVPESTFISDFYLRYRNANHKTKVIALDQFEQVLTAKKIDLALNVHSFPECRLEAVEWWISRLAGAEINRLFIVTDDGNDFSPILSRYGYKLLVHEHKYSDPIVQKYAVFPADYFLFGLD